LPDFNDGIIPAIYIGHITAKYLYNKDGRPTPYTDANIYNIDTENNNQMYYLDDNEDTVQLYWNGEQENPVIAHPHTCDINDIEDSMVCSDITQVYRCLLDSLLMQKDCCSTISDDLIRNYLILYGHQAALATGDFETAETYFKLM